MDTPVFVDIFDPDCNMKKKNKYEYIRNTGNDLSVIQKMFRLQKLKIGAGQMIRVLHVVSTMRRGGVETMLMNLYRHITREQIQFDFIVHGGVIGEYEEEIHKLGGKVFHVRTKTENFIGNLLDIRHIVRDNHYNIVHVHQDAMTMFALKEAKKGGARVRIAHAHSTSMPPSLLGKILYPYAIKRTTKYATHKFSCSERSSQYLFNGDIDDVYYIYNGIDVEKFKFKNETRANIRSQFSLEDAFVLGQVGNFMHPKNQLFTIDVFYELLNFRPSAKLVFCGGGNDLEVCKQKVNSLNLEDRVLFLGNVSNVHQMLSAFDALILPSFYEGFPVATVEAQCSGLSCYISDTITKETKITDRIHYCSLGDGPIKWAEQINKALEKNRSAYGDRIRLAGFEIRDISKKLEDFYRAL